MMAFPEPVKGALCVELLDLVKERLDLQNDSGLARFLGVSCGQVSYMRNGHREMSTKLLLKCFDALGLEVVRAALLAVSPGQIRSSLELVKKRAES